MGTTSYRRARDKHKRLKVYLGPKDKDRSEREFIRVELTLEKRVLRRYLQTGCNGVGFPVDVTAIDFGAFFKLCRLKDFNRLVSAITRREKQGSEPSMYNDILQATIRSSLDSSLFYSAHTVFRDDVHTGLDGANVAYWFEQVFPAKPKDI